MTTPLRVSSETQGSWTVLRAEGEIDLASVEILEKEVDRAIDSGSDRIAFDLQPVSFMDSTGLRVIVTTHQRLTDNGGRIAVIAGPGPVERLLDVSGLRQTLPVYTSLDDALE